MIVTVTPNVALDISHEVDALLVGQALRVRRVHGWAGGKGVNVSSVVTAMGEATTATGFVGGPTGAQVRADLDERHIPHHFTDVAGHTRRCVNVHATGDDTSTVLNEPGPVVTADDWARLVDDVVDVAVGAQVVVISGSLPPGSPPGSVAALVGALPDGVAVVLDIRGPELLAVLAGLGRRPALVKPNREELIETVGGTSALSAARLLQERAACTVAVSEGADGLVLVPLIGKPRRCRTAQPLRGNATGAGDALAAGLAVGLATRAEPDHMLRRAVAWSAAAVLQPHAGSVDSHDVAQILPTLVIEDVS